MMQVFLQKVVCKKTTFFVVGILRITDVSKFQRGPGFSFYLNADPDSAFYLDANPDPGRQTNSDPCGFWSDLAVTKSKL
jgi:hypothetical protein